MPVSLLERGGSAVETVVTEAIESANPFQDYADLIARLVPEGLGYRCYDHDGQAFWEAMPGQDLASTADFEAALAETLAQPDACNCVTVELPEEQWACILPLRGNGPERRGALAVFMEDSATECRRELPDTLAPVTRLLERELRLRYRLVDSRRKLRVQAAEENLLHAIESTVHQGSGSDATLETILQLCEKHLDVDAVTLDVPDRKIRLARRRATAPGASDNADMISLTVGTRHMSAPAIFTISGWHDSAFSGARRRRVCRYVVSQIEAVIARDYDRLTGLLAWPRFEAELEVACLSPQRHRHTLMFLDVDQLHVINENYGRETGDRVLASFAELLQARLGDFRATRITSDSFAVLLTDTSMDSAIPLAEQLCAAFKEVTIEANGRQLKPSACAGLGPLSEDGKGANGSLATAQVACRAAKDRGRGRVECYRPEDQSIVRRLDDIQLVSNVRDAILADRLTLLAQPIRPLKGPAEKQYFEVLVRMLNDAGDQLEPSEFLSAAERYQLMEDLDRWVVDHSLKLLQQAQLNYPGAPVRLAINLYGQSLSSESFLGFVEHTIQEFSAPPRLLCFEVTESVAVSNMQRAQNFMHALRKLGCHFSLDDFGTGLSSFAYLKLFPVDTLKIDGSFVRDVAINRVSQSVVAAISEVARVMGLETVAEFVQDEASLRLLRDLGVTWGQGYHLGEPRLLADCLRDVQPPLTGASRSA